MVNSEWSEVRRGMDDDGDPYLMALHASASAFA